MKKLQNNFTTPEQSKRLLELGVPADSADCVLVRNLYFPIGEYEIKVLDAKYSRFIEMHDTWEVVPCWSVGRLIEIYLICTDEYRVMDGLIIEKNATEPSLIENLVCKFERLADVIDFSKLED